MQAIKTVYFSIFGVFFRAAGSDWSDSMNCWKGVLGVTLVEWALIVTVDIWVQFFTQINVLSLVGKIGFNVLLALSFCVNYYALVTRGTGIRYEHELTKSNTSRRRLSTIAGNVATVVIIGLLIFSFYAANPHRTH